MADPRRIPVTPNPLSIEGQLEWVHIEPGDVVIVTVPTVDEDAVAALGAELQRRVPAGVIMLVTPQEGWRLDPYSRQALRELLDELDAAGEADA